MSALHACPPARRAAPGQLSGADASSELARLRALVAHQAELLDATTELVCTAGHGGRITYANRAWLDALGYAADAVVGLRAVELVVPEHRGRFVDVARRLQAGEAVDQFEAVLVARDGRRVVCRGRARPEMVDDAAAPGGRRCVGTRAVYRDVTAERRAEDARARLVATLEASEDFVGTAGPDGRIDYLNRAGRRLLGLADDAPLGALAATRFHPPETMERLAREAFPAALAHGRWSGDGTLLGAGGEAIPVSMAIVAHPSLVPGEPPFFSAVMRDLRERTFLATVLDSLSEHVSVCDAEGRLTLFNRATREAHGVAADPSLPADQWSARYDVFLPDGVTPFPADRMPHVRARAEAAPVEGVEFVIAPPDGPRRTMVASARALRGPGGELLGTVCAARDTTEQKAAEAALHDNAARLSLIYNSASDLMFLMAVEGDPLGGGGAYRCQSVNAPYLEVTGLAAGQVIGRTVEEVLPPAEAAHVLARYADAVRTGDVQRYDEAADLPTGRVVLETTLTPVLDDAGRCTHLLGVARDVSARRRVEAALRESEARFRGVLETVRAVAVTLDARGTVTFANDALLDLTGWARPEVLGRNWFDQFVPDGHQVRDVFYEQVMRGGIPAHYENEIVLRDGGRRLLAWDNTVLRDAAGLVTGVASLGQDVTERRALEARLAALSEHDDLTGLLNRRGFRRMAEAALRTARRGRRRDAVLYLDLDAFKPINDTHGHRAGDQALQAVARVLRDTIREGDVVGRLGGDEFAVYATGLAHEGEGHVLAARLVDALDAHNAAATAAGRPYAIRFTIGVAEVEREDDLDAALERADAELYARKLRRGAGAAGLTAPG